MPHTRTRAPARRREQKKSLRGVRYKVKPYALFPIGARRDIKPRAVFSKAVKYGTPPHLDLPHPWRPRLYPPRPPLRPTPPHTAAATLHPERARSRPPTRGRPQPVSADALLLWGWLLLTLPSSLPIFLLVPLRLCEIRVQAERLRGDRLLAHDKLSAAHSERCRRRRVELDRRAPPGYICLQAGWSEPRCIPRQPLTPRVATLDTWSRSLDLPPPPPLHTPL